MRKIDIDLFETADWLFTELKSYGVEFTNCGYPLFRKDFILWDKPSFILPYNHRLATPDKSKTVICYFMNDADLYKRLMNLKADLFELQGFLGICGFDLSPRIGWNAQLQKFNILVSQMATIWLAIQGVKCIPNYRIGNFSTAEALYSYPRNIPFSIGALGCFRRKLTLEEKLYFKMKILIANPAYFTIYGKMESELLEMITEAGIEYRLYPDFRSACFSKEGC